MIEEMPPLKIMATLSNTKQLLKVPSGKGSNDHLPMIDNLLKDRYRKLYSQAANKKRLLFNYKGLFC